MLAARTVTAGSLQQFLLTVHALRQFLLVLWGPWDAPGFLLTDSGWLFCEAINVRIQGIQGGIHAGSNGDPTPKLGILVV